MAPDNFEELRGIYIFTPAFSNTPFLIEDYDARSLLLIRIEINPRCTKEAVAGQIPPE